MRTYTFTTLITVRSFEDDIFTKDRDFIKYFKFIEGDNKNLGTNDAFCRRYYRYSFCFWKF